MRSNIDAESRPIADADDRRITDADHTARPGHKDDSHMDNLLTVAFEAHYKERNHHRRYQVTVGCDLLDDWTVAVEYGRTGQAGREIRYASADETKMKAIVRDRLS